jgi:acyl-CoA reductase-like NAD-dependent aldehyde dehydrogenase
LPAAHVNLVHGSGREVGTWLTEHPDVAFYAFTGSTAVGKAIQRAVGLRRTSLELGSISSTIVCEDADLNWVLPRCVDAAFRKAGQVCTSVQRIYVHEAIVDEFTDELAKRVRAIVVGDPWHSRTLVGPMISASEAKRAEAWIREAVTQGAELVHGGSREGAVLEPTLLRGVRQNMRVMCEEIFAPVVSLIPYQSFSEAIEQVNNTPYGLAAGVFTRDLNRALSAARLLRVGSVHVNETSSSRVDLMPYGGTKDSGSGREGPKYAIQEMTEERLVTISLTPRAAPAASAESSSIHSQAGQKASVT